MAAPRTTINSAPYVSLFLILCVIGMVPVNPSDGIPVGIARHVSCVQGEDSIVLAVRFDGSFISINTEALALTDWKHAYAGSLQPDLERCSCSTLTLTFPSAWLVKSLPVLRESFLWRY